MNDVKLAITETGTMVALFEDGTIISHIYPGPFIKELKTKLEELRDHSTRQTRRKL